ncbi:hypothetical protein F3Y22_tig00110339pilonHSYRG00264 [Hibiscus syriacus]|uniref:DUF7745 domain-containing protein n=1 Tax=Hibiscus syriacus TaxID=106335 RepID=A0A6A3AZV2_HIBSY|nr:hypothetical protein F3Y22_tig00110339pilonHSYRG00264 [Hibiscus syriacus]
MGHLWCSEHPQMKARIELLLKQQKLTKKDVKDILQEIKNPEVRLWSEKTQKVKGDSLQGSYVSELVSYASISLKQNNVQELRDIWDSWKNDRKQKFSQRYGDIALLLHVKTGEPLIRALVQFWNPGYSCFTFNQEDMVPTIEKYTTLLHCENIKLERAYIKHIKSQPFKNRLAKIVGVDEKCVTDRLRNKGNRQGIKWIHIRKLMNDQPDEWKTIDLFCTRPSCLSTIAEELAEVDSLDVFSSFKSGFTATFGRLIGLPTVDLELLGYAPLLALRHYGARQFVTATYELAKSEFEYHSDNYKKMIKEAVDSWKKVFRIDVVASRNMLTPDYVEWRRLRKNDNIPVPDSKIEFEAVNNELKQRVKELEAERYKVKDNSKLKVASEYWKDETHSLKRKFEGPYERAWKEQMKTAQRRLTGTELEAIVDGFKKKVSELQIVLFDGGLQWRFRWEQAQQRVKARDAFIRDFLDQVQKATRHLHGLAREAGMV